jgi:drug/metabolite transporter (DMT)-like permease
MALTAALLFALSIPASKVLLPQVPPLQLAGLLYLGAAMGVVPTIFRRGTLQAAWPADWTTRRRLLVILVFGGLLAPVLFLVGLRLSRAGTASVLLTFELAATALLGAVFFRDHLTRSATIGVFGVIGACALLFAPGGWPEVRSASLIIAACLCWGLDNVVTALIDGMQPTTLLLWKGTVAGAVNLGLGLLLAPWLISATTILSALGVGAISYGLSIVLYVSAAQQLGATRAQSLFASAPFMGAVLSSALLGEPWSPMLLVAMGLLIPSVVALLLSKHVHEHRHESDWHIHSHGHDDGIHIHPHAEPVARVPHTHWHRHDSVIHEHPHYPDLHHRHEH